MPPLQLPSGEIVKYGPYRYKNVETGQCIASWDKPANGKDVLYKGGDVGCLTDALLIDENM